MDDQTKQTDTKQTVTEPWAPAQPMAKDLLGQLGQGLSNTGLNTTETGALSALSHNAGAGNPFAPQITGLTNDLLGGGGPDRSGILTQAYDTYGQNVGATARGDYTNPTSNPWFQNYLSTVGNDVTNRMGGMYAAAGRDPSGAGNYAQNVGRGVAEGTAGTALSLYNSERDRQMGAASSLYGAGNTTGGLLSGLDQTRLGNRAAGAGMSGNALAAQNYGPTTQLAIEQMRRGIPIQQQQMIASMLLPLAGLGGTQNSTGTSIKEASPFDTFVKVTGGLKGLFGSGNPKDAAAMMAGG